MHEARSDMSWSWRRFVRVLEEVSGKARICLEWAWMLWSAHSSKYERNYYGLGMDALVSVMLVEHGIMVWAWMLWSAHSSKYERNYGLGMDALVSTFIKIRTELLWFGHGCSGQRDAFGTRTNFSWPSQYLVKVVSCRSARYTVRVSESKLPDESKFLHFAETQKC